MKSIALLFLLSCSFLAQSIEMVTYYGHDQVGNPIIAFDKNTGVVGTRDTSAYGTERHQPDNIYAFGDIGFTGQIDRSNNRIVYFNERYYLPKLRRFISPDSITVVNGGFRHIDRYGYGYGDPINTNDPSGKAAETPWDIANAALGWGTFARDVWVGNWWGAVESGVGASLDTAAAFVPFVPGGFSTSIRAKRLAGSIAEGSKNKYIPDSPLAKNPQSQGDDLWLPHPDAEGRAHTVLGGRISSTDGLLYRQSAEFSEAGSWPKLNGYDVLINQVDWGRHGRGDHLDVHKHDIFFQYNDPVNKIWIRAEGNQTPFDTWWYYD